ncbi:nucleotide exchange factor GrpE [Enhygromyxa salina]|uniref:Nucleotide exchange factor GrpE n=1 Tax=Enhygromyxa salina TaxID=215803 RepID=A0A2S9YMG3_9BACT|nr:nucleotide exchange factor GrpE [Enhygromyxa salina]PRQ06278.1 hypothetical protein ENSA7_39550 [Enhygromyxa salina]
MLDRIRAWLGPAPQAGDSEATSGSELDAELEVRLKMIARAQAKISLRLDEITELVGANHRAVLERLTAPTQAPTETLDEVLDALDRLDDARRSLGADQAAVADGLAGISLRLERFIAARGLRRHADTGAPPQGQRFRIVGTEDDPALADGVVTRVVRSAATRGDELIREGEVIVNRRAP